MVERITKKSLKNSAELERLREAVKSHVSGRSASEAARDLGVDRKQLERFIEDGSDIGGVMLRALGPVFPAEVGALLNMPHSADARPIWPNLAECLAMTAGNLTPEEEEHMRAYNNLWKWDRPVAEWLAELADFRKSRQEHQRSA